MHRKLENYTSYCFSLSSPIIFYTQLIIIGLIHCLDSAEGNQVHCLQWRKVHEIMENNAAICPLQSNLQVFGQPKEWRGDWINPPWFMSSIVN